MVLHWVEMATVLLRLVVGVEVVALGFGVDIVSFVLGLPPELIGETLFGRTYLSFLLRT